VQVGPAFSVCVPVSLCVLQCMSVCCSMWVSGYVNLRVYFSVYLFWSVLEGVCISTLVYVSSSQTVCLFFSVCFGYVCFSVRVCVCVCVCVNLCMGGVCVFLCVMVSVWGSGCLCILRLIVAV
jgi:hypothetical protein